MFREGNLGNSPQGEVNQPPQSQETISKKVFTQEELRDRYEKSYRDSEAEKFRNERIALRKKSDKEKVSSLQRKLASEDSVKRDTDYKKEVLDKQIRDIDDTYGKEISLELVTKEQGSRSLIKRLFYKVMQDPLVEKRKNIENDILATKKAIEEKQKEKTDLEASLVDDLASTDVKYIADKDWVNAKYQGPKKDLLESIRKVNSASRLAIENTLNQLQKGDLDISKLAQEANAIVVHSIPLDGWSMKNTSMNNNEVDTTRMTAEEKIAIIFDKKPDVSASIITAGERVNGQRTMDPFGLILDGKMIASYQQDTGTETQGDARIKHPEYRGNSTLLVNTPTEFGKISKEGVNSVMTPWNESIVHQPKVKAIYLDEKELAREDRGGEVTEYFSGDQEEEMRSKYIGASIGRGVPKSGPHEGKDIVRVKRKTTGMEKALAYAQEKYPELPVYIQKDDGIYTKEGVKVDARTIYQ